MSLILHRDIDVSVGTSSITPCYDVEQLETKTHVRLGPGESIEYTKHRVRLEGHPWPGCCPEETPGVHIVMDRPSKKRLEQSWSSEPKRLLLKQKGLWPARWGHPGCKTLQMWTARTSQPHKCLKWTPHWLMPKTRWCLWWNGLWLWWGTATQRRSILMWLASTNHLEIILLRNRATFSVVTEANKKNSDFLYEADHSMYILKALTGQSRDSWLPVRGKKRRRRYDLGSEQSGEHLRYITQT